MMTEFLMMMTNWSKVQAIKWICTCFTIIQEILEVVSVGGDDDDDDNGRYN